ncbi:hypothetical protein [Bradyrhizobium sp. CCBAU 25338]|uniref:hypothetical protein n=1 Tax=Bradyrhizobium sp. CCBAU 25338 TaxID=1641877 RepID=UPI0023030F2C|nr:hypothetical protein [Bradyrhizobium sp. CCBAU 25338]
MFEALSSLRSPIDWVTGSSAGAITAALIAGSRVACLRYQTPAAISAPGSARSIPACSVSFALLIIV